MSGLQDNAARGRIAARFAACAAEKRAAFMAYVMGGDPDAEKSLAVLKGLPSAGVDLIELGMPFTDPMADGPAVQRAGQRALAAGATLTSVLEMARRFREDDAETPLILMGYYNPIHSFGVSAFLEAAAAAGVDGLIVVDLPPEEDAALCLPARAAGLDFIRLATPTTDAARADSVIQNASGFVYFVSITGVTGAASAVADNVAADVQRLKAASGLPVVVGFGVKTPQTAAEIARVADGVVVGSAIVDTLASTTVEETLAFVRSLADGTRTAR